MSTWIGYVRVSTDGQVDGYGLPTQRAALRQWVAEHPGEQLLRVVVDKGLSGTLDHLDRPGLAEVLAAIATGRADGVLVPRLDRLARDLIIQERLILEVGRIGGRVRSAVGMEDQVLDGDPADPTRRFVRRVLGAAAEFDRDMIALRLATGRAAKAAAGGYACGRPPYGWAAKGKTLVPVPAEQRIITDIRGMRKLGSPLQEIADSLSESGDKTWSRETVRAILVRAGDIPMTGHEKRKRARRARTEVAA